MAFGSGRLGWPHFFSSVTRSNGGLSLGPSLVSTRSSPQGIPCIDGIFSILGLHGNLGFTFVATCNICSESLYRESNVRHRLPELIGFLSTWYRLQWLSHFCILYTCRTRTVWMMLPRSADSRRYRLKLKSSCMASGYLPTWIWENIALDSSAQVEYSGRSLCSGFLLSWENFSNGCLLLLLPMGSSYSKGNFPIVLGQSTLFSLNISNFSTIIPTKST